MQAFQYIKLAITFLLFLISPRLAVFYLVYVLIIWVVAKNPIYRGINSGIVKIQTHEEFYTLVGDPNFGEKPHQSKGGKHNNQA